MKKIIIHHQFKTWVKNTNINIGYFNFKFSNISNSTYKFFEPQRNTMFTLFYELIIFSLITISVIPLMIFDYNSLKNTELTRQIGMIISIILFFELILRWTYSKKLIGKGNKSYFLFFIQASTLIDLLAILPTFFIGNAVFLSLRIIRQFKIFKSTPGYKLIVNGITREKKTLKMLFALLFGVIIIGSLLIYNVEGPNVSDPINWNTKIEEFKDAIWLVFVTLTTIGFGDITPMTDIGQIIIGIVSVVSLITTALLTGVVLMGFTQEIEAQKILKKEKEKLKNEYMILHNKKKFVSNENDISEIEHNLTKIKLKVEQLNEDQRHIIQEDIEYEIDEKIKKIFQKKHIKIFDFKEDTKQFKQNRLKKKELKKEKKIKILEQKAIK